MARSIGAILAGFLYTVLLSIGADALLRVALPGVVHVDGSVDSAPALILTMLYVAFFAITGAWITARLAPNRPLGHALVLGVIALVVSIVLEAMTWTAAPPWYNIAGVLLVMPYAWIGGLLRVRQLAVGGSAALSSPR